MLPDFDASQYPDKLNLGCGWDLREGYLNVDLHAFHNPDLVADVTKLEMLPRGTYREIIAQDVLEHLPRQSTSAVLVGWSRLLSPGGTLQLRVPSVIDLAELLKEPQHQTISQQELLIQCLFGTQAYTEDCHYTTFTEVLLRHYLEQAGLEAETWSLRDGWLFEIEARKVREPVDVPVVEASAAPAAPEVEPTEPAATQAEAPEPAREEPVRTRPKLIRGLVRRGR